MEQINSIGEVMASVIDAVLIVYLLNNCFDSANKKRYIYSFICGVALFIPGHWMAQHFLVQSVSLIMIVALYCGLALKVEPVKSIISGVVVNVGLALVNISVMFLISVFSGQNVNELVNTIGMPRLVLIVLAKITFMFIGMAIVNKISHFVTFKKYQWVYICVYYVATFAVCTFVCVLLISRNFNFSETLLMLMIVLFMVILNVMTYFLIVRINNENMAEIENKMLNLQIGNQHNMIKKTSELYEETRALRHDMKHYFTTFSEMLRCGETKLVIKEMSKVLDTELNNVQMINLSNPILNAAINDKLNVCHRMGINTDIKISGSVSEEKSMDFALIISNVMENAIEAQAKLMDKYISLSMHEDSENVILEVRNYINKPPIKVGGELLTHKKDKVRHGYGVKNVKRIVRKYYGYIDIKEEKNEFVVTIIVPK